MSDFDGFTENREELVQRVVDHTMHSLNALYDHDARPEDGQVWTIQQQDRRGS